MSIKAALKKVPFLGEIADPQLEQLVDTGRVTSVDADQVIFHEGDQADCMYMILSGKAKVYLRDDKANEVVLAVLEAGDSFGELALIDSGTRSASTRTFCAT